MLNPRVISSGSWPRREKKSDGERRKVAAGQGGRCSKRPTAGLDTV